MYVFCRIEFLRLTFLSPEELVIGNFSEAGCTPQLIVFLKWRLISNEIVITFLKCLKEPELFSAKPGVVFAHNSA